MLFNRHILSIVSASIDLLVNKGLFLFARLLLITVVKLFKRVSVFAVLVFGLNLFPPFSHAGDSHASVLRLSHQSDVYPAAGYVAYLEDVDGNMTIDDVLTQQFINAGEESANLGVTDSSYWFSVSVINQDNAVRRWWLELQNPLLDYVDLYLVRGDGQIENSLSGDHYPLNFREIRVRNPVFKLELDPEEKVDVYIKINTYGSMTAPLFFWKPEAYPQKTANLQMEYGLYFGIILALLLYNLMLFVSIRDLNYLYYCIFVAAYAFCQFCYNGLAYEYIWPNSGHINLLAVFIATNIYGVFMLQFARSFIRVPDYFPQLNKIMLAMMVFVVIPFITFFFIDKSIGIRVNSFYLMFSIFLVLYAAAYAFYKGVQSARYFLIAWLAFLVGMIVFQFMLLGILPVNFFTLHGQQIGSAVEAVLLSFALAHRMRVLMEENERMQTNAKERLEQRVSERTIELDKAMSDLADANLRLKESSFNDGLTGVRNRFYFNEHYQKEWLRSCRDGYSLALLMLDIDHFKSINDTYGHLCGDQALKFLTKILKNIVNRPSDIIARYGGEEFVIVLPNTKIEGAYAIAERIRSALESRPFEFNGNKIVLTVSIGCTAGYPKVDESPESYIDVADKALYLAKRSGRNMVQAR